jgi:PKD repeat protein
MLRSIRPKYLIYLFLVLFTYNSVNAQVIVCEGSPCTSNDFTIETFYLGDEFGTPFGPGYCDPGTVVDAHLWVIFTANTAAARYDLYLHFNLYIDGVFIETVDECYFDDGPIPTNVMLDIYNFTWDCGAVVELRDLYMSWKTIVTGTCGCTSSHCLSETNILVEAPLIANFTWEENCLAPYLIDFTSTTSGGAPPYSYSWSFGDGGTSTLPNPSHTYATTGPYFVELTVLDTENTDSWGYEIVDFDSNLPPEIYAPPDSILSGCDTSVIGPLPYSETEVFITEAEFNAIGGSVFVGNEVVSISYIDVSSGTCLITVTRTFTIVDSCDNTDTDIQVFTINDDILPTASNPAPITIQCITDLPAPDPLVVTDEADNCSIPTVAFVSDVSDNQTCPETITRTYSVTDDCGNTINVTQSIIVNDDILPTASNPAPITIQCITDLPAPDPLVVTDEADNCSIPTVSVLSGDHYTYL